MESEQPERLGPSLVEHRSHQRLAQLHQLRLAVPLDGFEQLGNSSLSDILGLTYNSKEQRTKQLGPYMAQIDYPSPPGCEPKLRDG